MKKTTIMGFIAILLLISGLMVVSGDTTITNTGISTGSNSYTRQLFSEESKSVTVCNSGCDYNTVQDAVNDIPLHVAHAYDITISAGTYDEDVVIPYLSGSRFRDNVSEINNVRLIGDINTPSNVRIASIRTEGTDGTLSLHINGIELYKESSLDNERAALGIYGGSSTVLFYKSSIDCGELRRGIVVYNGKLAIQNVTMHKTAGGTYNCSQNGIATKYNSLVDVKGDSGLHGEINGYVYGAISGGITVYDSTVSTIVGDSGMAEELDGLIYDTGLKRFWDLDSVRNDFTIGGSLNYGNNDVTISSDSIASSYGVMFLDGEGSTSDDLDCITGGTTGEIIYLLPTSSSNDITFKNDNCGTTANRLNMVYNMDYTPTSKTGMVRCIYGQSATGWICEGFDAESGFLTVPELKITGVTGTGKAVCPKSPVDLGTCSDAVGAGGTCTCA